MTGKMTRSEALTLIMDARKAPIGQPIDSTLCMLCKTGIVLKQDFMIGLVGAAHVDCLNAEIDRMVGVERPIIQEESRLVGEGPWIASPPVKTKDAQQRLAIKTLDRLIRDKKLSLSESQLSTDQDSAQEQV